jgi:hypothetical protein
VQNDSRAGRQAADNEILINVSEGETRVAILEQGSFNELHIERENDRIVTGTVTLGRVSRVLPGMQAAFVDIGLEKAAFLYAGDYLDDTGLVDPDLLEEEDPPRPPPRPRHPAGRPTPARAGAGATAAGASSPRASTASSARDRRSWSRSRRTRSGPRAPASPRTSRSRVATSC